MAGACAGGEGPAVTFGTTQPPTSTSVGGSTVPPTGTTTATTVLTTTTATTSTVIPPTTTTLPPVPPRPQPDPRPPPPDAVTAAGAEGVLVVAGGGADYAAAPAGTVLGRAYEGLVFPVMGRDGDWFRVLTGCEEEVYMHDSEVAFTPGRDSAAGPQAGPGFDVAQAVVVLDPGHGGPNTGAIGPQTGLVEKVVNLDIARRARDLMAAPRRIDWETGRVLPGADIPPFGTVWVTRTEGPPGADIEAGLGFRAHMANQAGAHAFVSIHNNADPDGPFTGPGSEAFYRFSDDESKRLAGILMEEFHRSFDGLDVAWVADTDAGAKYRLQDDGVTDYYGVLRRARVPAVLAEAAFISNPPEEALLATEKFRHSYAEAIYRALVRFLTTDDPGGFFTEPYPRVNPAGSGAPQPECVVPRQPG